MYALFFKKTLVLSMCCAEVREQIPGFTFFLPLHETQEQNSGRQTCRRAPLASTSSHRSCAVRLSRKLVRYRLSTEKRKQQRLMWAVLFQGTFLGPDAGCACRHSPIGEGSRVTKVFVEALAEGATLKLSLA